MTVIEYFWSWISQSSNAGLNLFNNLLNNSITNPFWKLFLVVFFVGMSIRFILVPLVGNSLSGSDKAIVRHQKNKAIDADFREV